MLRGPAVLGALVASLGATGLAAQTQAVLGLGGGLFVPAKGSSSYRSDVNSSGYNVTGTLGIVTGRGTGSIRIDGQYTSVNFKKTPLGYTPYERSFALSFDLMVELFARGALRPYVLGGPTFAHYSYSASELGVGDASIGKLGFNAGAGTQIGRSQRFGGFIEARIVMTSKRKYYPLTAGLRLKFRRPSHPGDN